MVQLVNPADYSPGSSRRKQGVYEGDDWKFYRQPTGISHTACVERQGAQ